MYQKTGTTTGLFLFCENKGVAIGIREPLLYHSQIDDFLFG